jgi:hypothetical protein
MQLRELTEVEFNEFVNQFPIYSFYQSREYVVLWVRKVYYFICWNDWGIKIIAATLLLIKKIKRI